jgi:RNA polymerase sigma-70 factor (ECF subfamily)
VRRPSRLGDHRNSHDPDADAGRRRLEELVDANYDRLLGYALRRVDQPTDAADVVGDVFLAAWRRIDEVPEGDESILWLYGVARRTVANLRRGTRRRRALHVRLRAQIEALPVSEAEPQPSNSGSVVRALNTLSADDRELLTLTAWEGLSPAQIAAVIGVEAGTVRVRLHRARRRLKGLLDDDDLLKRSTPSGHMAGGQATAGPRPKEAQ